MPPTTKRASGTDTKNRLSIPISLFFARPLLGSVIYLGTVKYYAQIHLQVWQNSVCTGQGNLPLIT